MIINKIIYFPIEIKKREFDARCYQALKLIKEGFEVSICTKSAINQYRNKIKKGIVYFKSSGPRYYELMKSLYKNGHYIAVMDEEGLMLKDKDVYSMRYNIANFKYINNIFAWGETDYKILKKLFEKEKIIPIGSPRFDILNQKTNRLYFEQAKKIKKKYGKFILLNTFLVYVNHFAHNKSKGYLKSVGKVYNTKLSRKLIKISNQNVDLQKKVFQDYKNFVKIFSKTFPNYKLIIRPHPSEKQYVWKEISNKYKNVSCIIDQNTACSWMLASQFSISSNCTTAVESFFLKKFNINYRPYKKKKLISEYDLPKLCGYNIKNIKELINFIKRNYNNSDLKINYLNSKDKKTLKDKIINSDGICSVSRLSDYFNSNINFQKKSYEKVLNLNFFEKIKNRLRLFYLKIKLKVFKNKRSQFTIQKMPGMNEREIFEKINLYKKHLNLKIKFTVNEVEPGLFLIKNSKFKTN